MPNTTYKEVMDIYRNTLRNAQYFREEAKRLKEDEPKLSAEERLRLYACEDIAHELYKVAGELEQTREVNPPAKREDIPANQRVKVFHILIDDSVQIDEADNLIKAFAWNNSDKVLKTEFHATRELNN